jgi:thiol-disulfide isomerase/thioredoxin
MATKRRIAATVLVLVLASVAASCGGSDKKKTTAGIEETRPVTITGTALPKLASSGADPAVGTTIPEVTGQSFDGSPVAIRNDGRPKLILFVAHWCPHCRREVPLLAGYLKSHPLPAGVDLYTVSTGVVSNRPNYPPSAWLEEEHWPVKAMADSDKNQASDAFGLSAYPYFVGVDAQGKVVARTTGEITTDQFASIAQLTLGNR